MKNLIIFIILVFFLSVNNYSQILLEESEYSDKDYLFTILSEGFNTPTFPPAFWTSQIITGSTNWTFSSSTAYCNGFGSALYPFNNSNSGSMARLTTPAFTPTSGNRDSLIFSQAYCQKPGFTDALDIYISTNSGSTWQLFTTFTSPSLITAPSTGTFFTPNCNQWQNKSVYLPLNTNRIFFQAISGNGNNLYLDEVIVKPSGVTGVPNYSTETPVNFILYNNYPNPFNPSTNIRFDLIEKSSVKIVIYNSGGEEISVLVDETLNAGKYETSFTALNLASGIYFYKLIAGNFIDTKKMMLIK